MAAGAIVWRLSGGLYEDPAEDDVVSPALLGLSIAFGGFLCALGRRGRRLLAGIVGGGMLY